MHPPNHTDGQNKSVSERDGHSPFPIVGMGASAGGLEAFSQILGNLPENTGMAFVLIQHLNPRHESRLTELLGKSTQMPVLEAVHGLAVKANHIYVIPPNATLAISLGILHVTPRGESRGPHLPIDYFFRALAEDQQGRAVGVVLSGTGSDGTLGLCEIKAVGGITFAQEETSAGHAGMPLSAIDSGCVDFVLPPAEIAKRLGEIGGHPYLAPTLTLAAAEPTAEESYKAILAAVRANTGVDFSLYRDTTIKRRIMRRMALHSQNSVGEYATLLKDDRAEVDALYHDLLINVTSFFRDPEMFETLKTAVLPEVVKTKAPGDPLRVWVPGCSTGQEAYSLAITIQEFYDSQPTRPPVQIFATDLSDQTALEKARVGIYPESIEGEVSPERLRRFFKRDDHVYRIDKAIRDICVFARQNVTADPPFSHLDLISCRNMLIYLATPLQKRVLPMFHYALRMPGFLVLGNAETVGEFTDLFEPVDRGHRIYLKKPMPTRHQPVFPMGDFRAGTAFLSRRAAAPLPGVHDFQKEADRILLGRFAPPGVLVDENLDILQFRGRIGPFLEPPPGEPTTNILKMAREGLFLDLRNALNEAKKNNQTVRRDGVRVRANGGTQLISLEVIPVRQQGASICFLVLFQEPDTLAAGSIATERKQDAPAGSEQDNGDEVVRLRQELAATREYLQSMLEQQDAANEELRSANEEILSSNEELQSTNEELETAKEELQSANEELTTVNEQMQRRNAELDQANNDLTNLLSSTNIPVIMVGGDLRVRRFTAPAKKVMNLLPTDVGRPISDLNVATVVADLEALISDVIENMRSSEREIRDREGRWYMMRIYPYRTAAHKIDGAVIVLLDVDQIRRTQEELKRKTALLSHQAQLIELSQDAVIVRDADNFITSWNRGAEVMYGWSPAEALGEPLDKLLQTDPTVWAKLNAELEQQGTWEGELRQIRRDGTPLTIHSREVLVRDHHGARLAVLAIKRDITELRRVVEALKEADRRKDEFLALLAHELRNPIAPVRNAIEIMRLAGKNPETIAEISDMLERQVTQLSRIIEDLIDVTRIVQRKIELRVERVALTTVVDSALESCRSIMEGCGHKLTVSMPPDPLYLDADPIRLSQVFTNLLNNAAKYSNSGGQITLIAEKAPMERRADQDGTPDPGKLIVLVRDNGIGISKELLPHVFGLFTQGAHPTEQGRGGLGVGLAVVQSLVQMHGGQVEARSAGPGKGSEFVVRLPLAFAPTGEKTTPVNDAGKANANFASRKILVVDDTRDQAESLCLLLQMMGHEVRMALNGEEALETLKDFRPDVGLIDIGLPGINGYDVARQIRANPQFQDMVLVAQTGWGQEGDRRRSAEAGFNQHLVKPIALAELSDILQRVPPKLSNG